jgi:hypothetical protein
MLSALDLVRAFRILPFRGGPLFSVSFLFNSIIVIKVSP